LTQYLNVGGLLDRGANADDGPEPGRARPPIKDQLHRRWRISLWRVLQEHGRSWGGEITMILPIF